MSYGKEIQQYFNDKTHVGSLDPNNQNVGTGIVGNPKCGDVMKFQIEIENGKIKTARFKTFGCGAALASSAYAAEQIEGCGIDEATAKVKREVISQELKLPAVKIHCSCLAQEAYEAALLDFNKKQPKTEFFTVTDSALEYLRSAGTRFLVTTQTRGCSGTSYHIDTTEVSTGQSVKRGGVEVYVDPHAEMYMVGTTIDYEVRDDWEGLVFNNPNMGEKCKCGDSFHMSPTMAPTN